MKTPINIVLVDNGSSDNSVEEIKKQFPKVEIIQNSRNLGFAAGNNVGIRYALGKGANEILLLNNDTMFSSSALDILFKNDGDIVGPVLEFQRNGKNIYDLGGHINWWTGRATHEELDTKNRIASKTPNYVSGAAILVRRRVFEKIGLLDERYFLYYEDADFCSRARRSGFKIALEPNAIIYHKLGGSSGQRSSTNLYHNLRSNFLFINKNLVWWRKPIGWVYWSLLSGKVFINWFLAK